MTETTPRSRFRRAGFVAAAAGIVALAAGAGALAWLLLTPAGAQLAIERALRPHGGTVGAVTGSLAGPLALASLEIDSPALRLRASRVALDWSPVRLVKGELRIDSLRVASLDVETPPSDGPLAPPASLALPLRVVVLQSGIDRLRVATTGDAGEGVALRDLAVQGVVERDAWIVQSARAATPFGDVKLNGRLAAAAPFGLDLKGDVAGTRNGAAYRASVAAKGTLSRIEANLAGGEGGLAGTGTATVEPFGRHPLRKLVVQLEGLDLSAFAKAPKTDLAVDAELVPRDGALLAGSLKIANRAAGPWNRDRLPVESAAAQIRFEGERLEIRAAALRMSGGGKAQGDATWDGGNLDARVSVTDADLLALHTALRSTKLTGTVAATVSGAAQAFTVALSDPRFEVAGEARIADGTLTVPRVRLARGKAVAEGRGAIALSGDRAFTVEGRVASFDPAAFAAVPAGDLNGTFTAKGRLAKRLAAEGRIDVARSRYAGLPAQGHAAATLDGERLARADVDLTLGASRLAARGSFGAAGDALQVQASSPDLGPLGRAFGRSLGGRVALEGTVAGAPASPALRVSLDSAGLRLPGGVRIAALAGTLEVGAGESSGAVGSLALDGLSREGDKEPIVARATLSLKGTRAAHELRLEAGMPDKTVVRALFDGGLAAGARAPEWRGRLESLETSGAIVVALAAPAPLVVSAERVELAEATLAGEPGQARLALTRWTPAGLEARGSMQGLFVRSVTQLLGLPGRMGSTLVMSGDWDVRVGETVDGRVDFRRERGDLRVGDPRQPLGLEALALRAEAAGGRVRAFLEVRGKQAGQWQGEVAADVRRGDGGWELSPVAPLAGRFSIDVPDLAWMAAWVGPEVRLGGRLKGEGSLAGTVRDPAWSGRLEATGLSLRDPATGADVADGTIAVAFRDRDARLERFVLSAPWRPDADAARALASVKHPASGELTAEGSLDLGTRRGTLRMKANAFPLTRLATRFLAVSGEGRAELDGAATRLAGDFRADAGWFGIPSSAPPALSDDVIVERGPRAMEEPKASGPVRLDLRFNLGDNLYFVGRGVSTRLAGALRLEGEAGPNLRATGTIRAVGGTYDAYGNKLTLERGALNFVGPVDNPGLNILALRKGLPVEAGVEITGTVSRPKARLVSSPEVPDPEKLSWLVLGRSGQGEVSAADAALLVSTANAVLGREALPAAKILGGLGIDEIRIAQQDTSALGTLPESTVAGKTGSASAAEVLTVGKRLTDEIYVSYRQSLADAEGSLRVAWQFTKSLQVILQAGDRPGVDAVYRFSLERVPTLVK